MSKTKRCGCMAYLTVVRKGEQYVIQTFKMHISDHNHPLGEPVPRNYKQKLNEISHEAQSITNSLFPNFPQVTLIGDATVQEIPRPNRGFQLAKKYYSPKHGCYGLKSLTYHGCNGAVVLIESGEPAATSDVSMAKRDSIVTQVCVLQY